MLHSLCAALTAWSSLQGFEEVFDSGLQDALNEATFSCSLLDSSLGIAEQVLSSAAATQQLVAPQVRPLLACLPALLPATQRESSVEERGRDLVRETERGRE